jgi:DNA integrity scanning protein DisA with diadenylate cyclase activity
VLEAFSNLRWQDAVDIGIIAFALYWLIHMIKGTRAMHMAIGLVVVLLAYILSQTLGLITLEWVLRNFLGSIILVIIVVFQSDIRRALTHVGTAPLFAGVDRVQRGQILEEILDARVSRELIESICLPSSPIHDGALIIQKGRLTAAGCFLPLSANPELDKNLGARHRAAIGLTEETDAVAVVVSEERGEISLVVNGKVTPDLDGSELRNSLGGLLA